LLLAGFAEAKRVRVFADGWSAGAQRFRPAVIGAAWDDLAALVRAWDPGWPMPARAIVAFRCAGKPAAPPALRDLLWNTFGVPVFEQYLGPNLELLAFECEAHDGLHLANAGVHDPGCALRTELCACGNPTPRLCAVEEPEPASPRPMAMASGA